jgi:signal transduction histidine kinase/AmiR/NasT family two-component response regulator
MSSVLLSALLRLRLDVALLVLVAGAALVLCRRHARRHAALGDLPRSTLPLVGLLILGSAGVAEWITLFATEADVVSLATLVLARGTVLGLGAVVVALSLVAAVRFAVLRAQLRAREVSERALEQAKAAADQANRAKSDFLAVMSHEIRTPLNAVMGFATLLSETRLDDAQRGYLGTITSEGARLSSLINDILDFTKIEQGRLALERLPFAPAETAHEVLRLLSGKAQEKKIELRLEAQLAGPLLVAGDPLRFRQVLVNLVDNAIKFTPRGSVTVFLDWDAPRHPQPGRLGVRVRDTGIGIPREKLDRLFQMFVQADSSTTRRYGGTGLGLAICQRLVMLMGGKISVQSSAQGSEFSFDLPLPLVAPPAELAAPETIAASPNARRPRVLIVDDMETNRFLLEVFLRKHGFEPQLASGGAEAIRLAAQNQFDAILMDLQMPDLDGFTAAQRIREAETEGQHTPIIALTASIAKGTRERCLAAGMDEHLTKPLDLRRFKALLEHFISRARASSDAETSLAAASG